MNSILEKVDYLLSLSKRQEYSQDALDVVFALSKEPLGIGRLGRVFGYYVCEYAIATLEWLGLHSEYEKEKNKHTIDSQERIARLVESKPYLEY